MVQLASIVHEDPHRDSTEVENIPTSLALCPPENFSTVSPGVYRSSCPTQKNHAFLAHLGIKSILYFLPGEYPEENAKFISERKISLLHFPTKSNRVCLY